MKKIIIIGGGPAGLFAALSCSVNNEVLLLEKKNKPGRKLLITGSGQCNITHSGTPDEFLSHYGDKGKFLRKSLYSYTNSDLMAFLKKRDIPLTTNREGKVFPKSGEASHILEALLKECEKRKVKIYTDAQVTKLFKKNDTFIVKCKNGKEYSSDIAIITTGGKSYPLTGSTGDGYELAKTLGHSIIQPVPALTAIKIEDHFMSALSGLSFKNINMNVWREGKKLFSHKDDMLITHKGFSGPVVLNRSRFIEKGDILSFDFTGAGDSFLKDLKKNIQANGKLLISTILKKYEIPKKLISLILEKCSVDGTKKSSETGKKDLQAIAKGFSSTSFKVHSKEGFNKAMVTAGGINTKEINPSTMESRIEPGLFFAGEVMDIDGDTGGYNLQAAFSTAYIAGKEIASGGSADGQTPCV